MTVQKHQTVDAFLDNLNDDLRVQVDTLRALIVMTEPTLTEHIKWNAPSYKFNNEDRITFNLRNKENLVKIVLHMGATRKEDKHGEPVLDDDAGLIMWSSDIRGMITFADLNDITAKQGQFCDVIRRWLSISHIQ